MNNQKQILAVCLLELLKRKLKNKELIKIIEDNK